MRYAIRHPITDWPDYYPTVFLSELVKKLKSAYSKKHSFKIVNYPEYDDYGLGSIYSQQNLSIINPKNNKYIVFSFFDNWKHHFMRHLGWEPEKMVQFFYCGSFDYLDYYQWKASMETNNNIWAPHNIHDIYQPFYYHTYGVNEEHMESLYDNRNYDDLNPEIIFRGWIWPCRADMLDEIIKNPHNYEDIKIFEKRDENNNLEPDEYLNELSKYRCALSLPGGTAICNRDIECFAVGTPVIRPFLNTHFDDPLIPNYHYINFYHEANYWDEHPTYVDYTNVYKNLVHYWNQIKNNKEYLDFITLNAREWYCRNCTLSKNLEYVLSKINLEALNG